MTTDPPGAVLPPLGTVPGALDARLSPVGGRPAALPVQAPVEPTPAGNTPAAAALPSATAAAAGDVKQPSGPDREATDPEGDSEDAAREWADDRAAWAGSVFIKCHPTGKDWA